jgi:hypothetical protein
MTGMLGWLDFNYGRGLWMLDMSQAGPVCSAITLLPNSANAQSPSAALAITVQVEGKLSQGRFTSKTGNEYLKLEVRAWLGGLAC